MMKILIYTLLICQLLLVGCNDFLDREPIDFINPDEYFNTEDELKFYVTKCYEWLPTHPFRVGLGTFAKDNDSDNQTAVDYNPVFVPGEYRVPKEESKKWNFNNIRTANFFLSQVPRKYAADSIMGSGANIKHYIGQMYFFRAYDYFERLKYFGDFPIITKVLTDDYTQLVEASKRRPRNEVARFILSDLDSAIHYMSNTPPIQGQLTRDIAHLLKSRVALYEGSWLTFHKGTACVPGTESWPGTKAAYLSDYTIDIDKEITFFLTQAIESADLVASKYPLTPLQDFGKMFASEDLSDYPEAMLWRRYSEAESGLTHSVSYLLQNPGNGGGSGLTRSAIETFLMRDGTPIYSPSSIYQGDDVLADVKLDRDGRLAHTISIPNDTSYIDGNKVVLFKMPPIEQDNNAKSTTGYKPRKGLNTLGRDVQNQCAQASIVFRSAEAYLNYIEAYYLLNDNLGGNCDRYWRQIRHRAGVSEDYQKTIALTELDKENDLAIYSGEEMVTPTLYNIRRERRCEFMSEGFRWDDLCRWRALDMMKQYHIEGINLWGGNHLQYKNGVLIEEGNSGGKIANVSSRKETTYLRPNQIVRLNNPAFNGYTFMRAHYLSPIATLNFLLTTPDEGGAISSSVIYQNPGWSVYTGTTAEY